MTAKKKAVVEVGGEELALLLLLLMWYLRCNLVQYGVPVHAALLIHAHLLLIVAGNCSMVVFLF